MRIFARDVLILNGILDFTRSRYSHFMSPEITRKLVFGIFSEYNIGTLVRNCLSVYQSFTLPKSRRLHWGYPSQVELKKWHRSSINGTNFSISLKIFNHKRTNLQFHVWVHFGAWLGCHLTFVNYCFISLKLANFYATILKFILYLKHIS